MVLRLKNTHVNIILSFAQRINEGLLHLHWEGGNFIQKFVFLAFALQSALVNKVYF